MKKNLAVCLMLILNGLSAQIKDSLASPPKKGHNEIGVSVSSALFVLSGVTDYNERFTNVTFRHLFPKHHAVKLFTGVALFNGDNRDFQQSYMPTAGNTTIYPTSEKTTPSNFQIGIGYEYILGKKKLKQVFGLDLVYNNKYERNNFYYLKVQDTSGSGNAQDKITTRLDTGNYVRGTNFDKYGINLSYSLRYDHSKHWAFTVSCIGQYRMYRRKENGRDYSVSDFNMNGLLSDISVFYKF